MKTWNCNLTYMAVVLITLLIVSVSDGGASSVREVSLDEMLQQSQFVFEGKVLTSVATEDSPKRIYTYVTFEIVEIIKGEYPDNIITLRFLGGTAGELTMTISDMLVPQIGEHGLYFVESLERLQVHPLYGWSQGHLIVERDETGIDRVMTNRRQPFTLVESNSPEAQVSPYDKSVQPLSHGIARGLIVEQKGQENKGYAIKEFNNILKERLKKSQ